ncbi:MAG: hypothetical protein GEU90_05615 [Gemmatimonas sp.]|nr:hypothetical protein [Gemmatimonas sp.]
MTLKRLEGTWKAICLRGACLLLRAGRAPHRVPDWQREPSRILFLRQDRIGDAIVSSGLLRAIKESGRSITIDALASPANAPVLIRDPSVTAVHVFDKRRPGTFPSLVRSLRARRYDAVIDCMVTAPSLTSLLLMVASRASHRIGISGRGVDSALTIPVDRGVDCGHIVDLYSSFGTVFGIDPELTDWRPAIQLASAELAEADARWPRLESGRGRRLLVNVSAGKRERRWPDEHFIAVISRLRKRFEDLSSVAIGSPSEWDRVEHVAREAGAKALETPRIDDAMALVATADAVFTPDTSISHMASAFRTPALVMFPNRDGAAQWGLYDAPGVDLVGNVASLADLPIERVLPELEQLVESLLQPS